MFIISNFIDALKYVKRRRWDKKSKEFLEEEFPNTVSIYSRLMKGVDLSNQIISYYELNRKTIKWWKRIFFHLLDIAIVNSFIIYKKFVNSNITQKQFRLELVNTIQYLENINLN